VKTDLGLKRLYTFIRTTPSPAHTGFYLTWPFTTLVRLGFYMTSQGSSGVATDIRFRILQILRPSTPKKKKIVWCQIQNQSGWSALKAVPIRIPNRDRNRSCTIHTQNVICVTVIKCHNFEFATSVTRSVFFWVFLAKQIWSHFDHKCHKWSQIQMWLVQTCFYFCLDKNISEWTKYGKTYQKVRSVSVFCLECGSERLSQRCADLMGRSQSFENRKMRLAISFFESQKCDFGL